MDPFMASWRDVYSIAVKWRQVSEPCDSVVWVDKLRYGLMAVLYSSFLSDFGVCYFLVLMVLLICENNCCEIIYPILPPSFGKA